MLCFFRMAEYLSPQNPSLRNLLFVKHDQVNQVFHVHPDKNMIWYLELHEPGWFGDSIHGSLKAPTFVGTPSVRSNRDVAMYGRQGKRWGPQTGKRWKRGKLLVSRWQCSQGRWWPTSQEDATRYYVHLCALQAAGEEDGTLVTKFGRRQEGVRKRKMNGWRCNVICDLTPWPHRYVNPPTMTLIQLGDFQNW